MEWLIDDAKPISAETKREIAEGLKATLRSQRGEKRGSGAALAIRLKNMVVHDTRKWFGGADIRVDTLVIHGPNPNVDAKTYYQPTTLRFAGVHDNDRLAVGDPGLLIFYGHPLHFVDISISVSRDRKDTQDLAQLVDTRLSTNNFKTAATALAGLAVAAPQAAAVVAGVKAAATLANISAQLVHQATSATIALYHNSYTQSADAFGLGRHPTEGERRVNDLSFSYEILVDKKKQPARAP